MDAEREADNMLAVLNNVISELMTARNKVGNIRDKLRMRGVDEDDVRAAKSELASVANDVSLSADGLESAAEHVEE